MYEAFEYIKDENADTDDAAVDTCIVQCGGIDLYCNGWKHDVPWVWWIDLIEVVFIEIEHDVDIPVRDWEERMPGLVDTIYRARDEAYPKESIWHKAWTRLKSYASKPSWRSLHHHGNQQEPSSSPKAPIDSESSTRRQGE